MNEYRNIRRDIADTAARGVLIEDRLRVLGVVEQSLNPADLSAQLRRAEQNLKEERRQLKISEGILQDVQRECKAPNYPKVGPLALLVGRPGLHGRKKSVSEISLVLFNKDRIKSERRWWNSDLRMSKARVEHRDVSVGNIILVVDKGITRGLLIDWELSRYESDGGARAYERTGTRQFMSARLSSATEPQTRGLADDLESFLLVLLWVFDDANPAAKRRLISSEKSPVAYLNLSSPHFEHLLGKLLDGFEARYRVRLRLDPGPPISTVHLESHGWMLEMLRQALEDKNWGALQSKLS
ncbi:hypothetical protein B0H13DRAFT_2300676 [Mycena leptocephala]|nr:hypothetical protein B0H13DRAFT_2300676 [Mycena leptocephala]